MRYRRCLLIACLSVTCAAGFASAQRLLGPDPTTPRPGVFVRDSAVAGEKLALAQRMERLKEWDKSADVYQEIVEKYADRVVPARSAEGESSRRYTSVLLAVQELLGHWPAEGLAVYRARYETPAATMLEGVAPDDIAALNRVVQIYFPTDAAKNASMRLIELYIENGEFTAAAWLGERLLSNHPGIEAQRPAVLFRTALALHLSGNDQAAKAKLDELKQHDAAAKITLRAQETIAADELAKLLAQPVPVAHAGGADSWPIFGGDTTRGRVPDAHGRPGAKIAEIPFVRQRLRPMEKQQTKVLMDAERERRESGLALGIIPSLDRGELFYQDNTRVYAASADSGYALPGWVMTYGESRSRFPSKDVPVPMGSTQQLTVTVTDTSVLAILGQPDRYMQMDPNGQPLPPDAAAQLACLDRVTGARKWVFSPKQLPESQAALRALDLNGSPLVVGDNVYVAAKVGKPPVQFEDAWVLCISLADGKLRWACYLASGNAPGINFNNGMPMPSESVSHLSYGGGRVYACTNLGAIASIDAYAGTIAWLALYPKPHENLNNFMAMQLQQANGGMTPQRKPWAQNPVIVKDGNVFALPSDSPNLFIFNAADGTERTRIATSDFQSADTLLGVVDDKLILSSANRVYCINWPRYDAKKAATDNVHWYGLASGPGTGPENDDSIRGRGFVTTDAVFVPTRWGLKRILLKNGIVDESYPKEGVWPTGEGPGNVIVTGDQVVIAGADSINIYSDLALARAKLDRALAAAPRDPAPRLKYAETLFAAGQIDPAIAKLDEAIALLGGLNAMRPGAERDRAFARSLSFAERSLDPKVGTSDPALAASLYDRAAAAAQSPAQQVAFRLSRARFARTQRDFTAEVKLYQEILSNPAWRGVQVPSDDGSNPTTAALVAESGITQRLGDYPAAYKPFEQAAADAFAAAQKNRNADAMLALAQTYPNSKSAPQAMLAAADIYEAAGRFRPATQVLNQLYHKYHAVSDKPRIIEAQARNYLQLPDGVGIAIGRLNEGKQLPGVPQLTRPLKLPDGNTIESVTFGAAAELLQKYSAQLAAATLPDFHIPPSRPSDRSNVFLPEDPATIISDVDQLIVPPRELHHLSRNDRIVTWTNNQGVSIYAVGTNTPLGTNSTITTEPRGCAWIGSELLIWTEEKIAFLKGDSAGATWTVSIRALPAVDAITDEIELAAIPQQQGVVVQPGPVPVDPARAMNRRAMRMAMGRAAPPRAPQPPPRQPGEEQIDHVRAVADRVVIGTSDGRIVALELSNGNVAWQSRVTESPMTQFASSDDFLAFRFADEMGTQIAAIDTYAGQTVYRSAFNNENGQIPQNLALAPDGTLLFTLPDRLCGKDLYEPGKGLKFGDQQTVENNPVFNGMTRPEQLVVADGRVLAVSDNGQFVRVLSLDDGRENSNPLSTSATNNNVSLRLVGPRLYVINQRTAMGYDLDRPEQNWPGFIDPRITPRVRDAFVGKRHLVLLDQASGGENAAPNGAPPAAATRFRLIAYARYQRGPGAAGESGKLDQVPVVEHPAGIDAEHWQGVNGGFCYRSLDRKVHYLRGADVAKD